MDKNEYMQNKDLETSINEAVARYQLTETALFGRITVTTKPAERRIVIKKLSHLHAEGKKLQRYLSDYKSDNPVIRGALSFTTRTLDRYLDNLSTRIQTNQRVASHPDFKGEHLVRT